MSGCTIIKQGSPAHQLCSCPIQQGCCVLAMSPDTGHSHSSGLRHQTTLMQLMCKCVLLHLLSFRTPPTSTSIAVHPKPYLHGGIYRPRVQLRCCAGTVYCGLSYKLSLKFPADYPFKAPTVKFETPCFHPNVDTQGNICLDILKEKWSAAYSVRTVLLSIQSLLGEPNNDSPLNTYAAKPWDDQEGFERVLRKKYADHQA